MAEVDAVEPLPPVGAPSELTVALRVARRATDRAVDVRFAVPPGVTALVGPSGSGKSTVLFAIAGLLRPDSGHIALGSSIWFDAAVNVDVAAHRRRIAMVFQSLALFPHLTALENVAYGIAGAGRRARRARARAWLERFHIGHAAEQKPRTLSGGEAQRVALARAFATSPRAVLLDEPFSALDRTLRRSLVAEVGTLLRDLRVPVLLVTHEHDEARALGDRFVALRAGSVTAAGSMAELGST